MRLRRDFRSENQKNSKKGLKYFENYDDMILQA